MVYNYIRLSQIMPSVFFTVNNKLMAKYNVLSFSQILYAGATWVFLEG